MQGRLRTPHNFTHRITALAILSMIAALPLSATQEKVAIRVKGDVGQTVRTSSTDDIALNIGGESIKLEVKTITSTKVKEVDDAGNVTFDSTEESSSAKINGEAVESGESDKTTTTIKYSPQNEILSYATSDTEEDSTDLGVRMTSSMNVFFPDAPVGPGDKWEKEISADEKSGLRAGKASFEYLANETVGKAACAKISVSYTETGGSPSLTATSTQWVEIATGDVVQSEYKAQNIPFDMGTGETLMVSVTGTGKRISGNPVKALEVPADPNAEESDEDNIDAKVKDYTKLDGNLPLYHQRKDGRMSIFLELREDQLGKPMMLQVTASTGDSARVVAGDPIKDIVFEFRKMENGKIFMVVPNYYKRANSSLPIARAVDRSFAESYLESFDIEATQKDRKSILIDVSNLFIGDISQISELMAGGGNPLMGGGGSSYSQDREKTFVREVKNFPDNAYISSTYNFVGRGGGGGLADLLSPPAMTQPDQRSIALNLNYNLFALPTENGYMPRMYDRRVGYFTSAFQDFSNDIARDQTKQFIQRWHLVKKDPSAAKSDPVQPIVFYIDNAIPTEYREAVGKGLLVWNKAFEEIGFTNAVVVKQMPDDADFDHADMRYNVVRWVTSNDSAYMVAHFRTNPLTGQILNASITADANFARHLANAEYAKLEKAGIKGWLANASKPTLHNCTHPGQCNYRSEFMAQARIGLLSLRLTGLPGQMTENQYLNDALTHVVAHEFGHILGLRHNFIASTEYTMAQLSDAALMRNRDNAASVMDYTPFNIGALKKPGVKFYTSGPGTYDMFAIKYGYMLTQKTTEAEVAELARLASQTNTPGLAYQSDELADQLDPYITRFDMSKEPVQYWSRYGTLARYLLMNLDKTTPRPGQSFYVFTSDFEQLVSQYAQSSLQISRYIGGVRLNANFKGDPNQKPTFQPVTAADQRVALNHLNQFVFSPTAFEFPKRYYKYFTNNPNVPIEELSLQMETFPIRDQFAAIQSTLLNRVFSSSVLTSIANQEFKAEKPGESLTIAEVFKSVGPQIWAELGNGKETPALRRQLQVAHLDKMLTFALRPGSGVPADVKTLAWNELARLRTALKSSIRTAKGDYTPAHQRDALRKIERAFAAVESLAPSSGGGSSLLEQLLGGKTGN